MLLDRYSNSGKGDQTACPHCPRKNGLIRDVPISEDLCARLKEAMESVPRGKKLFVPDGKKTHDAIHALQEYIWRNRELIQDEDSDRPMSFQSLRHTFAAEEYLDMTEQGRSTASAEKAVSELLGHHRRDVTRIYLGSLKRGGSDG